MGLRALLAVCCLSLAIPALADTGLPFNEGAGISLVLRSGQAVNGTLQATLDPKWIIIDENGTRVAVRAEDVLIARTTDAGLDLAATALEERSGLTLFGVPNATDNRFRFTPQGMTQEVEGLTILEREAFLLGHYDKYRVPAYVSMRWSRDDLARGAGISYSRRGGFVPDEELPAFARVDSNSLDHANTGLERGHMARDEDLESFGYDAVRDGMLMSNMVPQQNRAPSRNHAIWGTLENAHNRIVGDQSADIPVIWVISGPIFDDQDGAAVQFVGEGIGVPDATYKIIAWFTTADEFRTMAFIIPQDASNFDLTTYLVSVDAVEARTGLDFFHELDDTAETSAESRIAASLFD